MELVKVGTINRNTYLVAVPDNTPSAVIENDLAKLLGIESTPDGYEVSVICRAQVDGAIEKLGILAWKIYEEIY